MSTVHGTAVARGARGVLIIGASGAGKSSLALRLMALGAGLVADDAVLLEKEGPHIVLRCPPAIAGMIEARGLGLLSVTPIERARLAFIVDLDKSAPTRYPKPQIRRIQGVETGVIRGKGQVGLDAVIWCLLGDGQLLPTG